MYMKCLQLFLVLLIVLQVKGCYHNCSKGLKLEINDKGDDDIPLCNNSFIFSSNLSSAVGILSRTDLYERFNSRWLLPSGLNADTNPAVIIQNNKLKSVGSLPEGIYTYEPNLTASSLPLYIGIYNDDNENMLVSSTVTLIIEDYFVQPTAIQLECIIENYPPTCLEWLINGSPANYSHTIDIINKTSTIYRSSFSIMSQPLIGNYSCSVTTLKTTTIQKSNFSQQLVEGPPNIIPSSLTLLSTDTLRIEWDHHYHLIPSDYMLSYTLMYRSDESNGSVSCGGMRQCDISGLTNNTSYEFVIVTESNYDNIHILPSIPSTINITGPDPIDPLSIAWELYDIADVKSAKISWSPGILHQSVTLSYTSSCYTELCSYGTNTVINSTSAAIPNMINGLTYSISLRANNPLGTSSSTDIIITQNIAKPLGSPVVRVDYVNSSFISISWNPISCCSSSGEMSRYLISLIQSDVIMETMELSSTHHQYTGLDHSTGYVIVMAAVNSAGMGPWVNRSVYTLVPPNPTTEPTNATSDTPAPTEDRTILTALGAAIGVIGGLLVALLLCAVCCIVTYVIIKIITSRNGRKKLAEDEDVDNMIYIQLEEQERCEIPYFLEFPTDTKASEGETVYFKVHIAGTPIPTWYWYHQGEPLTAQGNIQIFSDGTLIIDNIQQENEGVYTFIARNTAGDLKQDVQLEITTEDEEKLQDLQSQHARSLIIEHKPVPLDTLEKYVEMQHSNDNEPFNFLYTSLSPGGDGKTAKANENRERNRYKNIVPYDHNAVELDPIPVWDVFQHSYINASYIDGFDTKKKFIATQGPLPHTITDFWRMIWKEKSPIIVMLTNKIEGSRVKCEEYWPPSMSTEQDYGAFIVKLIAEEVFANFVIRRCLIHLSDGTQSFHEVEQFHYTAWPDHGVPDHGSPLLLFRQRVMQSYAKHGGPIVVHCSAGAGRTGTFIALDIGLEQVNSELQVDFVAIVNKLREQRMKMIQTSAQFMFLYDALLEYMLCDNTLISVAKLSEVMASLHKIGLNKKTGYEVQFQLIQKITPKSSGYKCDIGKVNREKNRPNALLPVDMRRVVLRGHSTDYINATYMDGYQLKKEFIITQSPMQSTVADFWKMIVQHRSLTIIMLCGLEENSKDICHQYWPSDVDTNIIFDNFSIKLMNELNESESIIRRTLGVKDSKSGVCQTVIQYQVMNWLPDGQCSNHCTIGNLYTLVSDNQRRGDTSYKPIIVHCSDTITRSAMYCAIHNAIEQAKLEQGVDIFQVVKAVRMQRPASINSLVHYKTIYEVVSFYLSSFTMYSQFRRDDTL